MKNATVVISCFVLTVLAGAGPHAQPPVNPSPGGSAAVPSAKSPNPADAADYRIVAGDKLRIEVYRDPQLSQSLQVRPDGRITLPLVGDIPAAGATPRELGGRLTERLKEYLNNPVVTVIVAEANPPMVYVMGEVNSPGAQPLREPTTVLQALAVAGGFKDFANTKKIRILRKGPNGSIQTIQFNYKEAVESTARPMLLQAGDTIIVP